jgi:hypothetical protein
MIADNCFIVGFETASAECVFLKRSQSDEYEQLSTLDDACTHVFMKLDAPIWTRVNSMYLSSKLDIQKGSECRLAFHGLVEKLDHELPPSTFKRKRRTGVVDRIEDERNIICRGLFKAETNLHLFLNMNVTLETDCAETGKITSSFGKQGKCRILLDRSIEPCAIQKIRDGEVQVTLLLKIYQSDKRIISYLDSEH